MPDTFQLPDMNYLLVNAPDDYYGGYSWYDFARDPGPGVVRSRRMLSEDRKSTRLNSRHRT